MALPVERHGPTVPCREIGVTPSPVSRAGSRLARPTCSQNKSAPGPASRTGPDAGPPSSITARAAPTGLSGHVAAQIAPKLTGRPVHDRRIGLDRARSRWLPRLDRR